MEKVRNVMEVKMDWLESRRKNKELTMNNWAIEYLENNPEIDFITLEKELQILVDEDIHIFLNSFNRYGNFDPVLSSIPNALLSALRNVGK